MSETSSAEERRIFRCPRHGRVTEAQYVERADFTLSLMMGHYAPYLDGMVDDWPLFTGCDQCDMWFHRGRQFKAKRSGES